MKSKLLAILIYSLFFPIFLLAGELSLELKPKISQLGEDINLTLTISGLSNPPKPNLPSHPNLKISGPHTEQRSNVTTINGKLTRTSSISYKYTINPLKAGKYRIGPFKYLGQQVQTPEFRVVGQETNKNNQKGSTTKNLFSKIKISTTKLYAGQEFDLDLLVYSKDISLGRDIKLLNMPKSGLNLSGFKQLNGSREIVNNQVYNVLRYRAKGFALTAGDFVLAPKLSVPIRVKSRNRRNNLFEVFYERHQTKRREIEPESLPVKILDLPPPEKDATFSGAVGEFNFQVSAQPLKLEVGEPVTLTMKITGQGNIANVSIPDLDFGENFKVYESRLVSKDINQNKGNGHKLFEQVVMPMTTNTTQIPRINFTYFDPIKEKYITVKQGPFILSVTPSSNKERLVVQNRKNQGESQSRLLGRDIIYLKQEPKHSRTNTYTKLINKPLFWFIQTLPLLIFSIVVWIQKRRIKLELNPAMARRQRAPRSARTGLSEASSALNDNDREKFFEAIWATLAAYFGHRLNLAPGQISPQVALKAMRKANMNDEDISEIENIFVNCELSRFSSADTNEDLQTQLTTLERIIRKCEKVSL